MNKNKFASIVLIITMLFIKTPAFCENNNPNKIILEKSTFDNKDYVKYQLTKVEEDNWQSIEHIIEGNDKKWEINYEIKLPAFFAYLNTKKMAKSFANETAQKYDPKWTKVILNRSNDTDVECFAKKDAVIHVSCRAKNHLLEREAEYIYISDPEMVNLFFGDKVFGIDSKDFFKKYGYTEDYTSLGTNTGYLSYSFSLKDSEEVEKLNVHFKNNKVDGISYDFIKDINLEKYSKDFKGFVSPQISDGLFTKGFCVKYGTKLRENPSKSTITSKIELDSEVYIIEYKEIKNKGTWVRLVTPEGIEGWTEGKNISPNIHCFYEPSRINATIDYLFDLGLRYAEEEPIKVKEENVNVLYNLKTKTFDGVEISELFSKISEDEEEEDDDDEDNDDDENNKEIENNNSNNADKKNENEDEEDDDDDEEDDEEEDEEEDNNDDDDNEEGELVRILITKPFLDFAGLKVGNNVEELKNISNKLSISGWIKIDKNEIKNDAIYSWLKKEDDDYTKRINIRLEQGKIASIELINLEIEY